MRACSCCSLASVSSLVPPCLVHRRLSFRAFEVLLAMLVSSTSKTIAVSKCMALCETNFNS